MKLITLLLLLANSLTQASILEAQSYFDQKQFKKSYAEYEKHAKLGNLRAQYNLAVMNFTGQGINKNTVDALAWATLVGKKDPEVKNLINKIKSKMPKDEISKAADKAQTLQDLYGYDEAKKHFGPLDFDGNSYKQFSYMSPYTIKTIKNTKIKFPNKAIGEGARGWVDISYNIYPDGSIHDFNVLDKYPTNHNHFVTAGIEYLEKIKLKVEAKNNNKPITQPIYTTFRVKFGLYGISDYSKPYQRKVDKLRNAALKGSLEAQYQFSNMYYSILNRGGGITEKVINKWLFRAAQFGIPKAQFQLGRNIFYGFGCKLEQQKGLDWILRAAQNNNSDAQYLSYDILTNYPELNNFTKKTAQYWLQKSAKNGSNIGQIRYAKTLINQPNPSKEDLHYALDLLDAYSKDIPETIDLFEYKAISLEKLGDYKMAKDFNKKALKLAKKSKRDLSRLKAQKQRIKQHG